MRNLKPLVPFDRRRFFCFAMAMLCAWFISGSSEAAEKSPGETADEPPGSGCQEGEMVPSFYSRVVTGPLRNKSVCYVCRNGKRPVVMVLARKLGPELQPFLQRLDEIVDRNRAAGLRSFGVLLSDQPLEDLSHVQTFAFDGKISTPLTVANDTLAGESCLKLDRSAQVTIVLYRERRVVSNFAFRVDELDDTQIRKVLTRVRRFAADDGEF